MPEFASVKPNEVFDSVTKTLKDVVYVSIGLSVIAFQRAQVQRQELRKQVAKLVRVGG